MPIQQKKRFAPTRDPYGGMVPFRPGKPLAPAPAPAAYGGMLPFRPGKVQADLAYEAEASKRRGGRSAFASPVHAQPQQTDNDLAALFARAGAPLEGSHYLADTAGMRAPGTLVTPKGLTRSAVADVRSGRTPNLTMQNFMANPPPIAPGPYAPGRVKMGGGLRVRSALDDAAAGGVAGPAVGQAPPAAPAPGPFDAPGSSQRFADFWNSPGRGRTIFDPVTNKMVPDTRYGGRSTALPTLSADGREGVRIQGSRGGTTPMDSDVREAYLMRRAGVMGDRQGLVTKKAQARSAGRTARLEARRRGPSFQDMLLAQVAQRDPAAAANLLGLSNYRGAQLGLQGQELGLRRELGQGSLGLQEKLAGQRSEDTRYVADAGAKESALERASREKLAQGESRDAGLAAALQFGTPAQKQQAMGQLLPGQGVLSPEAGATVAELPPEQKTVFDQAPPQEAAQAMRNQGVSESSIQRYLQQRQREFQDAEQRQTMAVNAGSFLNPALMLGNAAARVRGMFDAPPVGLNPEAVARLTPEQRRKLGIPEPKKPRTIFRPPPGTPDYFPAGG